MESRKQDILDKLFALHRFGIKPGLERTLELSEFCGNPHLKFQTVHVAGTNGKGSVCSMLASILTKAGYKTGLYTSPHLLDFNERIRIDGQKISDDDIISISEQLFEVSDRIGSTFFEITTVMAFEYFARNNVDIAIIETGMGGRYDSTNILNPLLSIITQIGIDHKEYLGNSIEEIAFEKAGIIKQDTPVIISGKQNEIRYIFEEKAKEENAPLYFSNESHPLEFIKTSDDFKTIAAEGDTKYIIPLPGRHQLDNFSAVLTATELLKSKYRITKAHISSGLDNLRENTGLISRIELIRKEPPVILDVSHNINAVQSFVNSISDSSYSHLKWNIIFGAMADKAIDDILGLIKPICKKLICVSPKIERALPLDKLAKMAEVKGFENVEKADSINRAYEKYKNSGEALLIFGSFYVIGELLEELED